MKSLKKLFYALARKFGMVVIPEWKMDTYLLGQRLNRIIDTYQIDCIFDVGANKGQYRDFLRNIVGYDGLIISFEPDPNNVSILQQRQSGDDRWIIQGRALGNDRQTLDFNIMESSVFNSFLKPDNTETREFDQINSIRETIQLETVRLDEIIDELKQAYPFRNLFLKLDTQGFDLEVFAGASGCIDLIRGVQTEVSVMPIYAGMPGMVDSFEAFKASGFEVSGLYSLSESRFPHAVEFDCIYLPRST